ncbi:alcohol dehydrogenase catalytic domain-containing protein [Micromonospora sp. NPDC047548]|uniref:alcohol dehydrogenase catalytic domain-containing protein n=1 Tax=Micromonospora sp. NPDC047548 TaxID=3155624 RepID=UPI0033F312D3
MPRVRRGGLCRSDWHGWQGHDPDIRPPHVPGHEYAGVVTAVGAGVRGWRPGDRVTAPFVCACGQCPAAVSPRRSGPWSARGGSPRASGWRCTAAAAEASPR